MKRENGFYWVKNAYNNWVIAEYYNDIWYKTGNEEEFLDLDFVEIDENRII
jgi:hypothetical protein